MSQKLHQLTLKWPASNATHVTVTGTFDNWSESVTMERLPEGGFVAQIEVPWDTTIFYKFVQDGNWLIDSQQPHRDDGSGQINNFYTSPSAPAPAANAAAEIETTLSAREGEGEVQPAATSESTEPAIVVKDHIDEPADKASTVPDPPAEAEVVPLATAVEHPTDIVPEAAAGPATHEDPPATHLPIVEVLPSSDALPTTAPVEPATDEPPAPAIAAPAETAPAPVVEATPTPVTEAAPAPTAEETPAVDDIIYATANTDATADAVVAAAKETAPEAAPVAAPATVTDVVAPAATDVTPAKETAPAASPAAVTDIVVPAATDDTPAKVDAAAKETAPATVTDVDVPAATDETPAKVDAVVAENAPTASGKPTFETPAEAIGEPKVVKASTTQPALAIKTEEANSTQLRPEGKGGVKSDRNSLTYSSIKGKLFPSHDHEKTDEVSEHGAAEVPRSASARSSPTREKRRSFFGRVAAIFKPSS